MILDRIFEVVKERIAQTDSDSSYVAKLHSEGLNKILKKISEETFEVIVAAKEGKKSEIVHESADLIFHLLVLLAEKDVHPAEILAELERRFGTSGIEEKKRRRLAKK